MNIAIYARVSTRRQERDQTVDSQLAALRAWAADAGHDLRPEHVFTDPGHSGGRLDRPGLDRLRDAAAGGGFDAVAVYSSDPLARRYIHQAILLEEFRKAGCPVAFVHRPIGDDPHEHLLLQIQGAVAEYERSVLAERFRRGKLQRARAGHWVPAIIDEATHQRAVAQLASNSARSRRNSRRFYLLRCLLACGQ